MPRDMKQIDGEIRSFTNKYEQAKMRGDVVNMRRYSKKITALHDELENLIKGV